MQVRIGNGGGGSSGVAIRFPGLRSVVSSFTGPANEIYLVAVAILLVIGIVLVALVVREYRLQKKNKK